MKKTLRKIRYALPLAVLVCLPYQAYASNVYIDANRSELYVGDSIVLNVRVDSENRTINAVEGKISLSHSSESVSINSLSLSESDFSLWPQRPTLSDDLKTISFSGGIPKGLNSGDAILFKIVLDLKKAERITLAPRNVSVYLNDGKGTRDTATTESIAVNILPQEPNSEPIDDWRTEISADKTPPEPFEILMGQEASVFDGKKFLSFNTTDGQSGITHYEVIEGDLPPVQSDRTYILVEQEEPTKVTVIAYDAAGNSRKSEYDPETYAVFYSIIIFTMLALLAKPTIVKLLRNAFARK